jgi:hypothetical protein
MGNIALEAIIVSGRGRANIEGRQRTLLRNKRLQGDARRILVYIPLPGELVGSCTDARGLHAIMIRNHIIPIFWLNRRAATE